MNTCTSTSHIPAQAEESDHQRLWEIVSGAHDTDQSFDVQTYKRPIFWQILWSKTIYSNQIYMEFYNFRILGTLLRPSDHVSKNRILVWA